MNHKTSSSLEPLVSLDRDRSEALHHQLERSLRASIRDGRLAPAESLPSTRALAAQIRISRGIVVEAYEQLVAAGTSPVDRAAPPGSPGRPDQRPTAGSISSRRPSSTTSVRAGRTCRSSRGRRGCARCAMSWRAHRASA